MFLFPYRVSEISQTKMNSSYPTILKKLIKIAFSACLSLALIFSAFAQSSFAAKTSMTGDFEKDTVSVAETLKETIELEKTSEGRSEEEEEAIFLISDYISRYRNRSQVNTTVSYTTMQTALNALAGHYKTFANRPVPENLKERLNKELTKAEKLVERGS